MDIFRTHAQIVDDYATYIRSFIKISDDQIRAEVERELEKGKLWPQPLLQFNPSFEMFGRMDDLTAKGKLHPDLRDIFRGFQLYRHQVEAIQIGTEGKDFVVTSGTGSGKSLTYIGTIFHHLLSNPGSKGVMIDTLREISGKVSNYRTTARISFRTLVRRKNLSLAVGVIGTPPSTSTNVEVPEESVFRSRGPLQKATRIDFKFSSIRNSRSLEYLYVPDFRERSLRKNCSLPSGKAVVAPYLVVAVYDPVTLLVIRLWVVPVWVSPDQLSINIVRSDAERGVQDALFDEGGVGFSPHNYAEMERIKVDLGHRLAGDIAMYKYVGDLLIFPEPNELPVLLEYYGVRGVKKYDASKKCKNQLGWSHHRLRHYRFLPIEAKNMERDVARQMGPRLMMTPKSEEHYDPRQRRPAAEFVRPILAWIKFWRASPQAKRLSA